MNLFFAFHNPTKVQHQNLTTEEFKKKLLEDTNLSNWLVWKPGMREWLSAADVPEVKDLLSQAQVPPPLPQPPPIPPAMKSSLADKKDDDGFFIVDYAEEEKPVKETPKNKPAASPKASESLKTPTPAEKARNEREHPRIKGRLRTIITNRERAFITYTRDISLGGVLLEHSIPDDLLKGSVDIFITAPTGKDSIVFRCQPIKNQSGQYRFSFMGVDAQNQEKLSSWLDHLGLGK